MYTHILNVSIVKGKFVMDNKQLVIGLLALSLPFGVGVSASAKTHALKMSVNKLTESSTYISGKTSAKATVSVTRYGISYAKGKANSKGVFKIKASSPLSSNWHYRVTATKKGYKTVSKYVLVKGISNKSSNQSSKAIQDQIASLNKQITALQQQVNEASQNSKTVYVNSSTDQSANSDSYDKNKDYWTGTSQNLYVSDPNWAMTLYTDGDVERDLLDGNKVSADRIWGATDSKIVTIQTWVNNAVNGMYPVEYNGQKLFAISSDVTQINADDSGNQMYYYKNPGSSDPCYMANYAPQASSVTPINNLLWVQYTPTGIEDWYGNSGSWSHTSM